MKFCSIILQFCRCGGLLDAKGNPDGFLSHFSSLRNLRLGRFFDSLSQPARRSVTAMQADFAALILWRKATNCALQGSGQPSPAMHLQSVQATVKMANAPELSLRGGRRPTWRPEREARGSALGVQSRSTRSECGKAIGEIAAAFPRLPRPLRGLAMTSREPLLFYRQPAPVAGAEPGPAVHSPAMADGEKNSPSGAW